MATMKNHSFGFNIDDPEQNQVHLWCEQLKRKKQLSEYIRRLIADDLKNRKKTPTSSGSGVKAVINNR